MVSGLGHLVISKHIPLLPHWPAWIVMISLEKRQRAWKHEGELSFKILGMIV